MAHSAGPGEFRFRSLIIPVYLPTLLFAIGQGAVIPILPLFALELGASVAVAGAMVAVRGIGTMMFDIPSGVMVSKLGERGAMLTGSLGLAIVGVGAALSPSVWVFAPLVFLMGCSWAIWLLARLTFATEISPPEYRGRVLSLLGGTNRIGNFAGPFLGGFLGLFFGLEAAFIMQAVLALAAAALMYLVVKEPARAVQHDEQSVHARVFAVMKEHRRIFATAGTVTVAIGVLRTARQAVIPLWGDHVGLDAAQVGIIFGLSSALDMTLFYPVGVIMDRLGRKWAAVPCLLTMSAGMIMIPLTGGFAALLVASLITGFGNGLGSGINMTLGADFSPPDARGEFLGVWRLVGDVGTAGGPLVVSGITGVATLGTASIATGGIGIVGALIMIFLVEEPRKRIQEVRERQTSAGP